VGRQPAYKLAAQPPPNITQRLQQLAIDLKLTPLQKRFTEALAADSNANKTDAYIAATGETNRKAASERGAVMIRNKKVQRYYREIMDAGHVALGERSRYRIMTAWEMRGRLSEIARADYKDFVRVLPTGGFEFDLQACIAAGKSWLIKELSHDAETGAAKVKLHDSMEAIKTLAKIEGLMQEGAPPATPAVLHRTLVLNILSQPEARQLMDTLGQRVIAAELAAPSPDMPEPPHGSESEPTDSPP
jgi:hypothetical protein